MERERPLLHSGFISELEKVHIFGMRVIRLIIGAVLLLCFLILSYVIWSDSLQLNEILIENERIENTFGKLLNSNVDMRFHINQINNEITSIEREYKEIDGKPSLKSFVSTHKNDNSNVRIVDRLLNEESAKQISDWIDINQNKQYKLIYKATRDGDSGKIFHEKVNDIFPTISLFKSQDLLFGGYTTKSWKGSEDYVKDENAFLFSLNKPKKYSVNYSWNAIYRRESSLGYYGKDDLIIRDNCLNTTLHYSNFPSSYGLNCNELELTNGQKAFSLLELEVYQVLDNN